MPPARREARILFSASDPGGSDRGVRRWPTEYTAPHPRTRQALKPCRRAPVFSPEVILDGLGDGVYVCDRERRIVYWNKGAERMTGWSAADVVGRKCLEDVLCHVDKDGRRLCGEELCPLHRSIVTGVATRLPIIVFALCKNGKRIATQVTAAPLRNAAGEIVGGVETFRDVSAMLSDLERARKIQAQTLELDLPPDPRLRFSTLSLPTTSWAATSIPSGNSTRTTTGLCWRTWKATAWRLPCTPCS